MTLPESTRIIPFNSDIDEWSARQALEAAHLSGGREPSLLLLYLPPGGSATIQTSGLAHQYATNAIKRKHVVHPARSSYTRHLPLSCSLLCGPLGLLQELRCHVRRVHSDPNPHRVIGGEALDDQRILGITECLCHF